MFQFILLTILLNSNAFAQSSSFKGYRAVEEEIGIRVNPAKKPFYLAAFLPDYQLVKLLGSWETSGAGSVFQNGQPNSVNMLIWYLALTDFSQALSKNCQNPGSLPTNSSFTLALNRICLWPDPSAKSDDVMLDYWLALMGYDAPEEEFLAWRDFFKQSSFKNKTAADVVSAMSLAIFMNPYFLLQN